MATTSGLFGKADLQPGQISKIWFNKSANAATCNIIFCNRGENDAKIKLAITPQTSIGGAPDNEDFITFNQPLPVASTFEFTGVVISPLESINCGSDQDGVCVRIHGFVDDRGPGVSDIGYATDTRPGLVKFSRGLNVTDTDTVTSPATVKALIDAYGGGGGGGGTSSNDGMMTGYGVRFTQYLQRPLEAGIEFGGLPNFIVGGNKLQIYINGILASCGMDKDRDAYYEMGVEGTYNNSVIFWDTYPKDTEITCII